MRKIRVMLRPDCGIDEEVHNEFEMDVTDEQLRFLMEVGRRSGLNQEFCCQTTLWIEVVNE